MCDALGLYENPANSFVAGFIGSPKMNLCPGEFHRRRAAPALKLLGGEVALHPLQAKALRGRWPTEAAGRAAPGRPPPAQRCGRLRHTARLQGVVDVVEHSGSEIFITVRVPTSSWWRGSPARSSPDGWGSRRARLQPESSVFLRGRHGGAADRSRSGPQGHWGGAGQRRPVPQRSTTLGDRHEDWAEGFTSHRAGVAVGRHRRRHRGVRRSEQWQLERLAELGQGQGDQGGLRLHLRV